MPSVTDDSGCGDTLPCHRLQHGRRADDARRCGAQGSQARRRVASYGPKARNFGYCGTVVDQLIGILAPKRGVFRPVLPPKCTCPPSKAPRWAAARNWPGPFHQLVEISKGSLRALAARRAGDSGPCKQVARATRGPRTWHVLKQLLPPGRLAADSPAQPLAAWCHSLS
jgi:hypothetical protein